MTADELRGAAWLSRYTTPDAGVLVRLWERRHP
jgi:hypothetical protein